MSKIDELIKEMCPNGVEYKELGEICEITTGKLNANEKVDDGLYPFFTCDKLPFRINKYAFNTSAILISGNGSQVGHLNSYEGKFNAYQRTYVLYEFKFVEKQYLLHYMRSYLKPYIILNCKKGSVPYITLPMLKNFKIPIPPLPIQREIVRILDSFTELTEELKNELKNELTARKKQYEFYRNDLLKFDHSIPMVTLGDVATVTKLAGFEFTNYVNYSDEGKIIALRGLNVKNGKLDLTDVKYIDNSDLSKLSRSKLHIGDMIFTYVGTIGQVALIDKEDKYYLAPNVALIRSTTDKLIPKYMRYYFQSGQFWHTQINKLLQSSSMKNIPMEKIRKFKLPLPPIDAQKRLVKVLDNFDAICSDLNIGLPAEIEARQKQYEYYRDALLTYAATGKIIEQTDRQTSKHN